MRMLLRRLTPVLLLILSAAAWARNPGDPIKPGWNLFSKDQDVRLGQQSAWLVREKYAEVHNPLLDDYIRRIGDRLAATPEAKQSGFRFTFTVLNVPQVNAFALPGGPMFIFTGLLKATENEAQLAGVMAHEMSHVILRHGTHEASKAKSVKLVAQLLGTATGNNSAAGQLANLGLGLGANSFILHFSREAESEADLLGSHLMAESGYNPIEMARFFETLGSLATQGPQFFSDHPNPGNRELAIETEIRGLPQREYGYETGQFQLAKTEVGYLRTPVPGPNGGLSNLPALAPPPKEWKMMTAKLYAVAFPANWSVYGEANSPVSFAPPDGLVKSPNGKVLMTYGATADYYDPGPNLSVGTATLKLVGYLHERDPNLEWRSTQQQKSVRVNDSEGLITALRGKSPNGAPETDVLLTVARPQGLFFVLFVSPEQSFPQFQRTFEQMIGTIRFNQ
jgi:beta-barrel assembly-enhancing protease